ncbi:hypothetical protein [Pseudoalteromonas piscicida]|uniref:Uncharacterized protein n=1 Tax=Pseudoalteromonas piscicida TaxID=43662 RepID=A0AAD0RKU5_PSEO7|nr:hypothetical protein [Pseudoalteromonas piscicida]ASD69732.1 hypothetical protein B1L02_23100 [Pseudoalteromonas piscicida]AXR00349.1 hypothetical protein D0N37_22795 [Pseudoalteromonas piscicida]AXR04772.1 hypothetical protein D0511_23220 [Pseudoalteromonas piscicida]
MNEEKSVKDAINAFYKGAGVDLTSSGEVNAKVAEIFGKMVEETRQCTAALKRMPKPTAAKATIGWIAKNFTQSIISQLSEEQSLSCAKKVILNYKSPMKLASLGV